MPTSKKYTVLQKTVGVLIFFCCNMRIVFPHVVANINVVWWNSDELVRSSSNNNENASIEEEKCIYLSKINNRQLGELVAAELVKREEEKLEAEDKLEAE